MTFRRQQRRVLATIAEETAVAQDTDALAADFAPEFEGSTVALTIVCSDTPTLKLVGSDGTVILLNGGSALTANVPLTEELSLDVARTWNLQCPDVGGATFTLLVVTEAVADGVLEV